ncbi:hypothetical protein B005_0892 [Nocardiopsis alba ATCC BAA-2165]|uniref:Uncharacterized protein n=1 Tax=Nocardiopsis alba (strain ATCC BAA-2165 / BE74) TaxID=1205910 RepID=J7LGV4_NOCAA|nr:hypothetical protein B005_0892 [Nocardiopsis alba ATCC BAA-2165]
MKGCPGSHLFSNPSSRCPFTRLEITPVTLAEALPRAL